VAVSGLVGYLLIAFVTLSIKDLPATAAASNPFQYAIEKAFSNPVFPAAVLWIVTIAQWFCGLACVTSTSRMMFALSRDKGMPLSHLWSRVSARFRSPAEAVWLSCTLAFLLPCLLLAALALMGKAGSFSTLYPAVTGISTIGLYLSYGIPLALKLNAIRTGVWTPKSNGPWNLGSWSVPVNTIAVVWIIFITVLFVLPPNELTGYIFGGTLLALLIYFFVAVRGKFRGPVPQATSEAELARMELELESGASH
jgi:amino acid transporter